MHKYYVNLLLAFLCLKTAAIVFVILYAGIGLGPDEAQYWTWSQHLDWGYYSKPPGIAWQNWLGTYLFGSTEIGVRSMALLIGFTVPLLVYTMAKACRLAPSTCFWASIA
ncbi:MAG: glycosyltransferase family 39 protein, partial [Parachlamydiaceae bacterium]|nr:glycosyltransferase family 39 protein [Parachlamydiaceae bacterium]